MFGSCHNLKSIDLFYNTHNVNNMSFLFYNCFNLSSINLSTFNTSNVIRMEYMFYSCLKLTSIDLSNFNTDKLVSIAKMFYDCNSLQFLDFSSFRGGTVNYYDLFHINSNISCIIIINESLDEDIEDEIPTNWIVYK